MSVDDLRYPATVHEDGRLATKTGLGRFAYRQRPRSGARRIDGVPASLEHPNSRFGSFWKCRRNAAVYANPHRAVLAQLDGRRCFEHCE